RAARVAHDALLIAVVTIPPGRIPQEVVRIARAQRAHYDVVQRRRVLSDAELAEPAGRNVQFTHRLPPAREERLLEDGIDPGAGNDAGAVKGAAPGEESALALDAVLRQHVFVDERAHEHVQQALVLAKIVFEPGDALLKRAAVRRLGDAEEVVVVAALLARILDDGGVVGRVDRGKRD